MANNDPQTILRETRNAAASLLSLAGVEDVLPVTQLQAGMLAETLKRPSRYCNWIELEVKSEAGKLQKAFLELARHHELLRTGFAQLEDLRGAFVQILFKELGEDAVRVVNSWESDFLLDDADKVLHPLQVQIISGEPCSVLVHIHHALYDGWSWELLCRDLRSLLLGESLVERPSFQRILDHDLQSRSIETLPETVNYWKETVSHLPNSRLPNLHGALPSSSGLARRHRDLDISLAKAESKARALGIKPAALFEVLFGYLLTFYLDSSRVSFGTVLAGRTIAVDGIEDIAGPCLQTLFYCVDIENEDSISDAAKRLHEMQLSLQQHANLSLHEIKRITGLAADTKLFDALFVWQQTSGKECEDILTERDSGDELEFGLTLEVKFLDGQLHAKATYETALFPDDQIDAFLQQFVDLVRHAIESPPTASLKSLWNSVDQRVLSILPARRENHEYPRLSSYVEDAAKGNPDKVAIAYGDPVSGELDIKELSYAVLNARANQLARFLQEQGVESDDLVCIILEKSFDLYIAILATVKLGAGYLPIMPDTPAGRIESILSQARPRLGLVAQQTSLPAGVLTIDYSSLDLSKFSETNLDIEPPLNNVAYTIFTSGTTGVPKGVAVTHGNLISNLVTLGELYPTRPDSRLLQFCPQAFDVSVFEIFFAWYRGLTLCFTTKAAALESFSSVINTLGVTHLSLTPTMAALIEPESVPNVRFLVTAGEAVTRKVFNAWAGKGLFQGYGPSETTNICTVKCRVSSRDSIDNIGPPLANTSAIVLLPGDDFKLAPLGGVGELCFGGSQVFRGYLGLPEQNRKKLIDHPQYGRIYRSGDYGRLLPSGDILYVGRRDLQVKIRGHRIELEEISRALMTLDIVENCNTIRTAHRNGSDQLVVFWIPRDQSLKELCLLDDKAFVRATKDLFTHLKNSLPAYMIPTFTIPVSYFPRTAQDKINTRELQSLLDDASDDQLEVYADLDGAEKPVLPSEKTITEALADTLELEASRLHRNQSFLSYGLDSLQAIRFVAKMKKLGLETASVALVLQSPSISALAERLEKGEPFDKVVQPSGHGLEDPVFQDIAVSCRREITAVEDVLPCTPLQEVMLSATVDDKKAYVNHFVFEFNGDKQRLWSSWESLCRREPILRTSFMTTNNHKFPFVQVVLAKFNPDFQISPDSANDSLSHRKEAFNPKFDGQVPPYSLYLVRSQLLLSIHHSLYDGHSLGAIFRLLERQYKSKSLPPFTPFRKFVEYSSQRDLKAAQEYWTKVFADFEPKRFPDLTASKDRQDLGYATSSLQCSVPLQDITRTCQKLSVSLLTAVQAAWIRLLASYTNEEDLCFGHVAGGRTAPVDGIENIVGPCFNTVPVRVNLSQLTTNIDLMKALLSFHAKADPHTFFPFRRLRLAGHTSSSSLFDTIVILQSSPLRLDESVWKLAEDIGEPLASVTVEVVCDAAQDRLHFKLAHQANLIRPEDAPLILSCFEETFLNCLNNAEGKLSDFSWLETPLKASVPEISEAIPHLNAPSIDEMFSSTARLRKEDPAIKFWTSAGSETWTYAQLDEKSDQLAQVLLSKGVSVEDSVVICMEKSPVYYACVLAALKAGAAFTPIEPSTPAERRKFMVNELRCKMLLYAAGDVNFEENLCPMLDVTSNYSVPEAKQSVKERSSSNLAYRMYTSGSTGTPKAVSIEHTAALNAIACARKEIDVSRDEHFLQFASITFDMCYFDCFLAWSVGGCLCIARQDDLRDNLSQIVQDLGVTFLDLTPTVASKVVPEDCPSVKTLYCIGEPLTQEVADRWAGRCINSYGPTEAAMLCTARTIRDDQSSKVAGRPFKTTSFDIVKAGSLNVQPIFGIGELCIGGRQLARDYYDKPDLTAQKFVELENRRVYRTGDFARIYPDGSLEPLGRMDDQVKIRGMRVELGDISSAISKHMKHPVVTRLLNNAHGTVQLVSFLAVGQKVCNKADADASYRGSFVEKARQEAARMLPPHMVPSAILLLPKVPLSAAGKVDNRRLEAALRDANISDADTLPKKSQRDWTMKELEILQILSDTTNLSIDQSSQETTIYEIGLDSINSVAFSSTLRKRGIPVATREVLERPSLGQLIPYICTKSKQSGEDVKMDVLNAFRTQHEETVKRSIPNPEGLQDILPATDAQQGMLVQFIQSQGVAYFNHVVFKLAYDTDVEKLRTAWAKTQSHLDILRNGFVELDRGFGSIVWDAGVAELPWIVDDEREDSKVAVNFWLPRLRQQTADGLHVPPWHLVLLSKPRILMLFAHHALFDARTLELMYRTVSEAYRGQSLTLDGHIRRPLAAILELMKARSADSERYWKDIGSGINRSELPNMATSRVESQTTNVVELDWDPTTFSPKMCREKGVSVQAVLRASLARLLGAYTNDDAVTFGLVLTGHTTVDELENTIFPCIATLPTSYNLQQSNNQLVKSIIDSDNVFFASQLSPASQIRKWIGYPEGDPFDTILSYQKITAERKGLWQIESEAAYAEYKVAVEVEERPDCPLHVRITHRVDIMPQEQALLFARQLEAFVVDTLTAPEHRSRQYTLSQELSSIIPAKEPCIDSPAKVLHDFVTLAAAESPDKTALEFWRGVHTEEPQVEKYSFRELNNEGEKIASALLHRGVKPKSLVATCFDKCPQASFALLGILKAGCAFVPIDPGAPLDRKSFILEDSKACCILTTSSLAQSLEHTGDIPVIQLDNPDNIYANGTTTDEIESTIFEEDLCYCLYTSGTTGKPKGCEITHKNAVQAMCAFKRLYGGRTTAESRFLQFASFHFDVSIMEQFWSWSVGIAMVSCSRDEMLEDIAGTIVKLNISHVDLTPSLAQLVKPEDMPHLVKGVFIIGGEAMRQNILDTWADTGAVYNAYGPTEVTIGCTMYPNVQRLAKPSNIGCQFDNVGSFVLSAKGDEAVVRGGVGELCVSGPLVGRGYLNRPDLNDTKFTFLKRYGERVYRTGDLVRLLHDGAFEFLGRQDDQVKLRGQRLELGEIESVVRSSQAGVEDCKTLVLKHPKQGKDQLVAFVVFKDNPASSERIDRVSQWCRRSLQPYMIPTHFLPIEKIPLSVNNKADAKALREHFANIDVEKLMHADADDNTWNFTEERIRQAVSKTIDSDEEEIQKHQNFFHLGLDSISMLRLARNMKVEGFASVTVSMLVQNPSVARLAEALSSSNHTGVDEKYLDQYERQLAAFVQRYAFDISQDLGMNDDSIERIAPCTALQEGFIAYALRASTPHYFTRIGFNLNSRLDLSRLFGAWKSAARDIEILRTCFSSTPDGYAQIVLHDCDPSIKTAEVAPDKLRAQRDADHEAWWKASKTLKQPPWEVRIYQTGQSNVMDLSIYHGLYDGYSLPSLLSEIEKRHDGIETAVESFQDVLPYGPLADHDASRPFWTKAFTDFTYVSLPKLCQEPAYSDITVKASMQISSELKPVQRALGAPYQAIFLACWLSVLDEHIGDDFVTGIVVSGRSNLPEEMQDVIGPVFNTIPIRCQVKSANTLRKLVSQLQQYLAEASAFQHTPLRKISKWTGHAKLLDNYFVYQQHDDSDLSAAEKLWKLESASAPIDGALALEVNYLSDGKIDLTLASDGSVLDLEMARQLLNEYQEAIIALVQDPNASFKGDSTLPKDTEKSQIPTHINESASISSFEWSEQSTALREEISVLAQLEPTKIKPETSILELGLDSIDAVKLSSRLRRRGIALNMSKIMAALTIERMVAQIETSSKTSKDKSEAEFDAVCKRLRDILETPSGQEVMPATPMQEAMLAETVASDFTRYINHDILRLRNDIDIEQLKFALTAVVQHSPILRTTFHEVEDPEVNTVFAQVVHQKSQLRWTETTVADGTDVLEDITSLFVEEKKHITLAEPLYHFLLVKAKNENYLALTIHHALYDGWSLGLLHRDISDTYHGEIVSRPANKPFIQRAVRTLKESEQYWRNNLRGLSTTLFSKAYKPDATSKSYHSQPSSVSLQSLEACCRKERTTLRTLGETSWAITLSQLLRQREVTFGTVLSGREDPESEQVLFPLMNTTLTRVVIHGTHTELLSYVQALSSASVVHQNVSLRNIQRLWGGNSKIFDTLFLYQPSQKTASTRPPIFASVSSDADDEYTVAVEMAVSDELVWTVRCSHIADSGRLVEEIVKALDKTLNRIVNNPGARPMITVSSKGHKRVGNGITRRNDNADHTNDWSEAELSVIEVLCAISKTPVDKISRSGTIYHLGLDSISCIKVASALKRKDLPVKMRDLLAAENIDELVKTVISSTDVKSTSTPQDRTAEDRSWEKAALEALKKNDIAPESMESLNPATPGQVYMICRWQATRGQEFYASFPFILPIKLQQSQLREAWRLLVKSASVLRSSVLAVEDDIRFVQVTWRDFPTQFSWLESVDDYETALKAMDIDARLPPVQLFATEHSQGTLVILRIHHILYDAVTLPRLQAELLKAVKGEPLDRTLNSQPSLLPLSDSKAQQKEFWTDYLKSTAPSKYKEWESTLDDPLVEILLKNRFSNRSNVARQAKIHGLGVNALFFASLAKVLASRTSTSDLVLGVYLANRSSDEAEDGSRFFPTANVVPLRIKDVKRRDLIDVARGVQRDLQIISQSPNVWASLLQVYEWTGVVVDHIVNILSIPDEPSHASSTEDQQDRVLSYEGVIPGALLSKAESRDGQFQCPEHLQYKQSGKIFPPALNVEIKQMALGVDIGMFCPSSMYTEEDVKDIVSQMEAQLSAL